MSSSESKYFYITTTLPYVNSDPHVGFATEIIRADAIARYKKLIGYNVFFNTGTDEHGQKLFDDAQKAGKPVQEYVDFYAEKFRGLKEALGIADDVHFIRTTDAKHEAAAQEFWKRCDANGYIYKKAYQAKYCVGCELEKTDSELVDGKCPIHPNKEIQLIEEENYFFKWSAFQDKLLELYAAHPDLVIPDFRFNEIKSFVEGGLQDFSISRLKSKMSWGIPVPGDDDHVMYVWFDALVNYISTLDWPETEGVASGDFESYWRNGTPIQYCGKDNLRQQSAMWQAMLMAADLPPTKHIIINGFLTGDGGIKMSKSLGNAVNPYDVVEEYGTDAIRYFCLAELSVFEDSPFTMERFKDAYNAKLANGIGNLTNRIMKMAISYEVQYGDFSGITIADTQEFKRYTNAFESFDVSTAAAIVWEKVSAMDKYIQDTEPFKMVKVEPEQAKNIVAYLVRQLYEVALMLEPILPTTSNTIKECVLAKQMPEQALFLRKE